MFKDEYEAITSRLPLRKLTRSECCKEEYTYPKSRKRDDIIEWLVHTQFVDNYVIKLIGSDDTSVDDVIQDIYLDILEMPQEGWDRLTNQGYGAIRAYVSGMIYRQIVSANSPSYYKYRRYNQNRCGLEDQYNLEDDYDYQEA